MVRPALAVPLVVAVLVFVAVSSELRVDAPDLNDSALHLGLAQRASEALSRGESPVDFWHDDVGLGYPIFHHYQHLPHLTLVAAHRALLGSVSMPTLYLGSIGALLALFPLSIFFAMRRAGFDAWDAACASMVAPLISTPALYGLGAESYVWAGSGLYTQLFASVLAPVALAETWRAAETGRGLARASVLLAATFLAHLVYGYIAALSAIVLIGAGSGWEKRAIRVGMMLAGMAAAASYFLIPALRDSAFANHSMWELAEKWSSLGAERVLTLGARGSLFDHGRAPVITMLTLAGLARAVRHKHERHLRVVALLLLVWLLLYFGRPTWGLLLTFLPLSADIPLHRFIGAVHLFAIPIAGAGLAWIVQVIRPAQSRARLASAAAAVILLLAPAVHERAGYARNSATWKAQARAAIAADEGIGPLMERLSSLRDGRTYVGIPRRSSEYLRTGGVPVSALCMVRGVDTLGFLWHSMTRVGDVQVLFNPDSETHCRTFGVRYLVFDAARTPPAFATLMATFGRYRLYEVPSARYFDAAPPLAASQVDTRGAYAMAERWLQSSEPAARVLSAPGTVVRADEAWSCDVDFNAAGAAVLKVGFHPGLRAFVDGQPVDPFPVAPGYAAVTVPPGNHHVEFDYAPAPRWPWLLVGAIALVAAAPASRRLESSLAPRLRDVRIPVLARVNPHIPAVVVLAVIAGLPLLQDRELAGHDAAEYVTQLVEFDHVLRDGQFPPRWAPHFDAGRGTAFFQFAPPLLLITAEALHLSGIGVIASLNLAVLGFLVLAAVLMFLFVRDEWGERAGLVAAVAFLFSPYVLLDLYVRHAFLEISALPWMPLAAWGVARRQRMTVAVATALLLLSHPALAAFFLPALLIYAWARRSIAVSVTGIVGGVALAAWFFVPAMLESQHLKVAEVTRSGYLNYANHFVTLRQLLWSPWGFGLSMPGTADGMSFRLGIPHLAGIAAAVWLLRSRERWALAGMAALSIFFATSLSKPVWDSLPPLHAIQFPWRALAVFAFAASVAAGMAFARIPWTATVVFVAFGLPLVGPERFLDLQPPTPAIIAQEDLQPGTAGIFDPRAAVKRPWSSEYVSGTAGAHVLALERGSNRVRAAVKANAPATMQFDLNWFPGWMATVDEQPAPIRVVGPMMFVDVPAGAHDVELRFEMTRVRNASAAVSFLAVIVALSALQWRRRARSAS